MAKRSKKEITELLAEVTDGKYAELKSTNERLLKRIDKLNDKNSDLIDAVYRAVKDGINSLDLPPVVDIILSNSLSISLFTLLMLP